jgi:hypothetical protein
MRDGERERERGMSDRSVTTVASPKKKGSAPFSVSV